MRSAECSRIIMQLDSSETLPSAMVIGRTTGGIVRTNDMIAPDWAHPSLLYALLAGLLLAVLTVVQTAPEASVLNDESGLSQREPTTATRGQVQSAHAQAGSEAPCPHHDSGSRCAPCQHCTTPVPTVPEQLESDSVDVRQHSPPSVTQFFPASLLKPPRQTR